MSNLFTAHGDNSFSGVVLQTVRLFMGLTCMRNLNYIVSIASFINQSTPDFSYYGNIINTVIQKLGREWK